MSIQDKARARAEVERARFRSGIRDFLSVLRGIPNELIPFDWVKYLNPDGESHVGVRAIPVDAIIGSVDRYSEFDRYFLPKEQHLDERWIGVRAAQLEGRELPPIQVYQVGGVYFVKDGNHRVSVARRNHQAYIDAHVIELHVTIPPEMGDTLKDLIIKGEYARFLVVTGLGSLVPDHKPVTFTTPGRYDIVLDHIRTRQYYLDRKVEGQGEPVTWSQAVESWYRRLYLRITDEIEEHGVMDRFPGRTPGDLYLWIMDHRYFLSQQYGHDVGSEEATMDFARKYAPRPLRRLKDRARMWRHGGRKRQP